MGACKGGGGKVIAETRIRPYPPNLRRIAAKIMEPAMGASTWALGSQRCKRKRGSFTRKAVLVKAQIQGRVWGLGDRFGE